MRFKPIAIEVLASASWHVFHHEDFPCICLNMLVLIGKDYLLRFKPFYFCHVDYVTNPIMGGNLRFQSFCKVYKYFNSEVKQNNSSQTSS